MRALLLLTVGLVVATPAGEAQGVPTDSARSVVPYGLATTYGELQAERRQLRRLPPDPAEAEQTGDPMLGIGQLVVDETVSRSGSYFYDVFYRLWSPPEDSRFMSVVLSEQPLPGQGTLVAIRLDGELVFQARLSPREEEAEQLARQAVVFVLRRLPRGEE
ncbi:CsgE family curli-type amyloid fiber assembly protein [Rubrivirga marina]|uniref:Curli production assembly/transport component CsgE n=1 Tax=Rubrivirga marina TaxID=1196024 RepID=A0A271J1R8_9BACT|nr:CsgE family curli-type amyloid fiber assembly protein [Rubrivirga marina]PAP77442.1 hypothetical protein BSZ37_13855 [Rubrivirga marina]